MQRVHRIRHRVIWFIWVPIIVLVFALAFSNRIEMPTMESVPGVFLEGQP